MKKLYFIIPRRDIRLKNISPNHCELIWCFNNIPYLVIITVDGHLSVSSQLKIDNEYALNDSTLKTFVKVFLNQGTSFTHYNTINASHIQIDESCHQLDPNFEKLYNHLEKQNLLPPSIFDVLMTKK